MWDLYMKKGAKILIKRFYCSRFGSITWLHFWLMWQNHFQIKAKTHYRLDLMKKYLLYIFQSHFQIRETGLYLDSVLSNYFKFPWEIEKDGGCGYCKDTLNWNCVNQLNFKEFTRNVNKVRFQPRKERL